MDMAAPVFQGKSTAQPPIARTATARARSSTAVQGTRTGLDGASSGVSRPPSAASSAAVTSAAAQSQSRSPGQSVPRASPTAPGATNTPSGPASFAPLSVTVPPATWKRLFPRPITSASRYPGSGSSPPSAQTASPSAARPSCRLSLSVASPTRHWVVKAAVLYMMTAAEKSPPEARTGPNSAAAQTASVRKCATELKMSSIFRTSPFFDAVPPALFQPVYHGTHFLSIAALSIFRWFLALCKPIHPHLIPGPLLWYAG